MLRFRFTLPCIQFAIRAAPKVKAWVIVSVLLFACQSPIHTHGPVNSPRANAGRPSHDTEASVPAGLSAARWTVDDAGLPSPILSPRTRPPTGWASLNAGYSVRYHQPVGMNAELARSGYTQVGPTVRGVTTSVEIATGRLRLGIMDFAGGSRTYRLSNSDAQFDVSTLWIAPATVGYELVQLSGSINDRWWILSAYPMAGIAVGILKLQYEPGSPPILADHPSAIDSNSVERSSGLLLLALGTEYIHLVSPGPESLGVRVDLRTGYYHQVISGSWNAEGGQLPKDPPLDMSAPFVRFTVGLVHSFR